MVDPKDYPSHYTYGPRKVPSFPYWLRSGLWRAARNTLTNIYFWTNIIFFAYCVGILLIDYDLYNWDSYDDINQHYIAWNWVHFVSAFMYIAAWLQYGYPVLSVVHLPEILNVVGASLYLASGYLYGQENVPSSDDDSGSSTSSSSSSSDPVPAYTNDATMKVHRYELAASLIELVASFGWAATWYIAYERLPGRGWTLDDPDTWSNICILIGAFIYVVYNVQITMDNASYADNYLYTYGDIVYFLSAVFYVLAAMRDCGWFFWMPMSGKWSYDMVPQEESWASGVPNNSATNGSAAAGETPKAGPDVGSPLLLRKADKFIQI